MTFTYDIIVRNTTSFPRNLDVTIEFFNDFNQGTEILSDTISPSWIQINEEQVTISSENMEPSFPGRFWPYIASFSASDTTKGSFSTFRTYIYNPRDINYLEFIKYKIEPDDYNWDEWVYYYYCGLLNPFSMTVFVDEVGPIIDESYFAPKYALNAGFYDVTEVYAEGLNWYDRYYPSHSGEFDVINQEHEVFIFTVHDQEWLTHHSQPDYYLNLAFQPFYNEFQISWVGGWSIQTDWNPDQESDMDTLISLVKQAAGSYLELSGGLWTSSETTSSYNNGFDLLIGFTGHWADHTGAVPALGSSISVITGGSLIYLDPLSHGEVDNLVQHEISHNYAADDRWDWETWLGQPSVMSKPLGLYILENWGWIDYDIIYPRRSYFDGFPPP